jgi:hypothetical protein
MAIYNNYKKAKVFVATSTNDTVEKIVGKFHWSRLFRSWQ